MGMAVGVYGCILLARGVVIWVKADKAQPGVQFLEQVTEPVLSPLRSFFPAAGFDVSPIVAIVLLWVANWLVVMLITSMFFHPVSPMMY